MVIIAIILTDIILFYKYHATCLRKMKGWKRSKGPM